MHADARAGFSLLELLLVIFIISLVYFLGFEALSEEKRKEPSLTPLMLKQTLLQSGLFAKGGTFLCTDKCKQCYYRSDISEPFEPYKGKIDLSGLSVYTLDKDYHLVEPEYGRYKDHKICLLIRFHPNGSSTPLILENAKGTYYLPAYFTQAQQTQSPQKAQALWTAHAHTLSNRGDFY